MTIAVMSDLHDNTAAWQVITKILTKQRITELINCGDTAAPAMLEEMSKTFSGHIDTVFGNVADRELETAIAPLLKNVTHHGNQGQVMIDGKQIFFNHFPKISEQAAQAGDFDIACHGHTHLKRWEKISQTYILNPGTAGGMFQYPSFATIDLTTMNCSFIDLTV